MTDQMTISDELAYPSPPAVRKIGVADLKEALVRGFEDFWATPTQLVFLCVVYPIIGGILARAASGSGLMQLIYPLVTGFALIGPFAALGIYELSRRREQGLPVSWVNAFDIFASKSIGTIVVLGMVLLGLFLAWLATADALYGYFFADVKPASFGDLIGMVLTTRAGWELFFAGTFIGFLFAAAVLTLTVVSFPLLLDRDVGIAIAVQTSIRAVMTNKTTMAVWGLIVAGSLLVGCLPLFVGLAIALPILGHATWHLYRRVVVWDDA